MTSDRKKPGVALWSTVALVGGRDMGQTRLAIQMPPFPTYGLLFDKRQHILNAYECRTGYNRGMAIAFAVMGAAFAAFCAWLIVRIVNRRERWAKWTAVSLLMPIAYCVGFGPACWLVDRGHLAARPAAIVYLPVLKFIRSYDDREFARPILWYAAIGAAYDPGWTMTRMLDAAGQIGFKTGVWPRDMRHGVPHQSDDVQL